MEIDVEFFSRKIQLIGDLAIEKLRLIKLIQHLFPSPELASLGFLYKLLEIASQRLLIVQKHLLFCIIERSVGCERG